MELGDLLGCHRHCLRPQILVHDPDAIRSREDQAQDLVELPFLMALAEGRTIVQDDLHALVEVVETVNPALERGSEESRRDVLVSFLSNPLGVDPHRVLEHRSPNFVEVDDVEVFRLIELTGVGVDRLQHLGVLVVDHRLGGVDVPIEEGGHCEVLPNQLNIFHTGLADGRGQFELVAKAPVADLLACPVLRRLNAGVGKGDLEGSRTLEDLGDIHDIRPALA